ncbi:unnamed protein product [Hymenolepis diminuta]|nr:unnamed protein product [Hymenolepis diminuta]
MAYLSLLAFLISICIVLNEDVKATTLAVHNSVKFIESKNRTTTSDGNSTTSTPSLEENDINDPGDVDPVDVISKILENTTSTTTPKPKFKPTPRRRPHPRPFPFFGLLPLPFFKWQPRFPRVNLGPRIIPRVPIRLPFLPGIG